MHRAPGGVARASCGRHVPRTASTIQKDVAERADVHVMQYGRYERGDSKPSVDVFRRLPTALEVSFDHLLGNAMEAEARATLHDMKLLQLFQAVEQFPESEKLAIKNVLDAF